MPEMVDQEQVVEGAVDRPEVQARIAPILVLVQRVDLGVEALETPAVVARHQLAVVPQVNASSYFASQRIA